MTKESLLSAIKLITKLIGIFAKDPVVLVIAALIEFLIDIYEDIED